MTQVRRSSGFRLNFRMLLLAAVVCVPVGYMLYLYIDSELSGGVKTRSDGYSEVDLKAMSLFEFDQEQGRLKDVPEKWRALDGKKIIVRGEIAPTAFSARNASEFDLVYSVAKCCLTGRPLVQHFVRSTLPGGTTAPYYQGLIEVRGTLHVNVEHDDNQVTSIYQIDVDSVAPVM